MKDTLEALYVIAPGGFNAARRGGDGGLSKSPVYRESKISPEKRYINQRLNSKMFFNEQISSMPFDKNQSFEDRQKPIREIIEKQIVDKSMPMNHNKSDNNQAASQIQKDHIPLNNL